MSSLYMMIVVVVAGILAAGVIALVARTRGAGARQPQPHVPFTVQAPPLERAVPPVEERVQDQGRLHSTGRPARRRAA